MWLWKHMKFGEGIIWLEWFCFTSIRCLDHFICEFHLAMRSFRNTNVLSRAHTHTRAIALPILCNQLFHTLVSHYNRSLLCLCMLMYKADAFVVCARALASCSLWQRSKTSYNPIWNVERAMNGYEFERKALLLIFTLCVLITIQGGAKNRSTHTRTHRTSHFICSVLRFTSNKRKNKCPTIFSFGVFERICVFVCVCVWRCVGPCGWAN